MTNVVPLKGAKEAPRSQRSSMETLIINSDQVNTWEIPVFQRELRVNNKVMKVAEDLKLDPVIPGVITLGRLKNSQTVYIVDGQHRVHGFKISGLEEVIADVRILHFDSMAEMADEFAMLNTALVKLNPDDMLRALEESTPALREIRAQCAFVSYGNVRRGDQRSPVLSMSAVLRSWCGSMGETPVGYLSGRTAATLAKEVDEQSVSQLIKFLHLAFTAWGQDPEYYRLWGACNISICMWLYRRLVLDKTRGVRRYVVLNDNQFKQCLMTLSVSQDYLDYLVGRSLSERDRSPAFNKIKQLFAKRLQMEGNPKPLLPSPPWASH